VAITRVAAADCLIAFVEADQAKVAIADNRVGELDLEWDVEMLKPRAGAMTASPMRR
jgi:hypothetical protein